MFTKTDKILDIVADHPEKEVIFKPYDDLIGKCVMCSHLFDTIEEFCKMYGLDEAELLRKLNSRDTI
ncbi:hypothetical protein [Gudongella oleilytica]|jgi:hypothetical protein|uniref:hypothetical protein n=1 Tax=Gudongella oleilytica TaxID=1582259 RepID=UPI000FF87E3A|nr:hypothetical protein [Gudongella oleilytica]MDY0256511.1 hypothetical protein [Gudongella oleilytica]HMM70217.1 hypothetical protein [Gudongella oleilytica]